ncbi:hypothetical protein, partial [Flavobacterium croceum]|uniref:hypothetical protein n=1 Tax=Flavobacterium croceum TaxID=370975 RepID=UPI001B80A0BA
KKWTFRQVLKFKWLFKLKCLTSESRRKYGTQRFSAWRCGGFLAQKFNRITAVELCTNVS